MEHFRSFVHHGRHEHLDLVGKSSDDESNLAGYKVERSTDGGWSWSRIYQGTATSTTDSIAFGTTSVMYRVKAYDTDGLESGWRTSSRVTVVNNNAPSAPPSIAVPKGCQGRQHAGDLVDCGQ